jgi:hypothetical protein
MPRRSRQESLGRVAPPLLPLAPVQFSRCDSGQAPRDLDYLLTFNGYMDNEILRYHSALAYNREVFLLEHAQYVKVFSQIDDNFASLIEPLARRRDAKGKSLVSLIPFVFLIQRQCRSAFEAFSAFQGYQAWLLLRPGIEAFLIVGKWIDDPGLAKTWEKRRDDWRAYQKAYSGPALRSNSLPNSDQIQSVLSKINDDFVHANPDYYGRHLAVEAVADPGYVGFRLEHFDGGVILEAHVLAFLHLVLVMQEALASLVGNLFAMRLELGAKAAAFNALFGEKIKKLASDSEEAAKILRELGCLAV